MMFSLDWNNQVVIAIFSLILALVMDSVLGDPPNWLHPVVLMGNVIRWIERNGPKNNPQRQFWFGALGILLGGSVFAFLPWLLMRLLQPYPLVWLVVQAALLKAVFSIKRLLSAGHEVERALEADQLDEARRALSWHLVSRDTSILTSGQVASGTIESLAENFTDSIVAPLLMYALGGIPLAWFYRFANTADAMIGYHDEQHEYLGKFAARLDDVLNWIPARLSGWLIVLAAWFTGDDGRNAGRVMIEQYGATASPNAGWSMSAAAGALGVRLEKIGHYRLDGGRALPQFQHIRRARRLVASAVFVFCDILLLVWGSMAYAI